MDFIEKEFDNYFSLFDINNYDIKYKHEHSYRVKKIANNIAVSLKLDEEDVYLANVIGLLHDIGRFMQLKLYGSFSDLNIDHADLGVKILFEENLIDKFNIEKKYYEIIEFAIKNHNKLEIENTNDNKKLLHAKIIRDADKIDILKAYTIYEDYKINEIEDEISKQVSNLFYSNNNIKKHLMKNSNDNIILLLSFVYDINFNVSLDIIKKERLYKRLYENIKNKNIFNSYFNHIFNYLEKE